MTHAMFWDDETNDLVIVGRIPLNQIDEFFAETYEVCRARPRIVANWHNCLMMFLNTMITPKPDEDPKVVYTIKLWRLISGSGLREAKNYIESVVAKRAEPPRGDEYGDLDGNILQQFMDILRGAPT